MEARSSFLSPTTAIPGIADIVHTLQTVTDQQNQAVPHKKQPSIVEIIELVQRSYDAYRPLTPDEQDQISRWSGWGPYAPAFEARPSEKWQTVGPQIRMLLGAEGYEAASAATPTSFFTAPYIARGIWRLAELLGFSGGMVLEPGCGTGQVLSHAPSSLDLHVTGIERTIHR